MKQYQFKVENSNNVDWDKIYSLKETIFYQTHDWVKFLIKAFDITPFVVAIGLDNEVVGYFIGMKMKKFGISIVGSPFEGWTTPYQGITMVREIPNNERVIIYEQLIDFCFKGGYCLFLQFSDWQLETEDLQNTKLNYKLSHSYKLDLSKEPEELLKSFKDKSCRYSIKKAQKLGIIVEEAKSKEEFVDSYYSQLVDVFAKQRLKPTYSKERVMVMVNTLDESNELLLIEAREPETKKSIATVIYVMFNGLAFYWGAASYREYQKLCPNEILMYEAMKIAQKRGCTLLEMEGIRKYKEKYNPERYSKPVVVAAKYSVLILFKDLAKKTYYFTRRLFSCFYGKNN